jgi:hypothetical protein
MTVKERHYPKISGLVRRDRTDSGIHNLDHATPKKLAGKIFAGVMPPVSPAEPRLVGTAAGDIKRILFTITNYAASEPILAAAYQSLLAQLPKQVEVVVLVQESSEAAVSGWLAQYDYADRMQVDTFADELNISIWAEDGYVVASDGARGATYFIEPYAFPRYADGRTRAAADRCGKPCSVGRARFYRAHAERLPPVRGESWRGPLHQKIPRAIVSFGPTGSGIRDPGSVPD